MSMLAIIDNLAYGVLGFCLFGMFLFIGLMIHSEHLNSKTNTYPIKTDNEDVE